MFLALGLQKWRIQRNETIAMTETLSMTALGINFKGSTFHGASVHVPYHDNNNLEMVMIIMIKIALSCYSSAPHDFGQVCEYS